MVIYIRWQRCASVYLFAPGTKYEEWFKTTIHKGKLQLEPYSLFSSLTSSLLVGYVNPKQLNKQTLIYFPM